MTSLSNFTLITGGARSGKSSFAELFAAKPKLPVIYIATAQILDSEMALRVKQHRLQRPSSWRLVEEPLCIRDALLQLKYEDGVILLDCVTLWLSNLLLQEPAKPQDQKEDYADIESRILAMVHEVATLAQEIKPQVVFVTNEVGQGIVPEYPLSRAYRDLAGRCNQLLARHADQVYFVVAGYPMEIKAAGEKLLNSMIKE